MEPASDFALRRTIQPYVAQLVVYGVATLLMLFDVLTTHNWNLLQFIALAWGVFIVTNYDNTRYRIFWQDGQIKQIAVFGNVTIIKPSEITRIALETSDLRTMLSMTRPLRRIGAIVHRFKGAGAGEWHS